MKTSYLLDKTYHLLRNKFSGEDLEGNGETFFEWADNLSYVVADMCSWIDQAKLVNLITHLQRTSLCILPNMEERSEYTQLKVMLAEGFILVWTQAVHNNLFH